jgi:hypothetical protein
LQGSHYAQIQWTNGAVVPADEYAIGTGSWFFLDQLGGQFQSNSTGTWSNITLGNDASIIAQGNITGANLTTAGNITAGGNLTVTGNTTVTGGIRKSARVLTTTTTLTLADASGFVEFTSGPYTVTLPNPTLAANSGIGYRFWQNTASNITLSTPAGAFYGPSGSTTSTVVLAQATTQYWDVWSDGYNWAVFGIKIA